MDMHTSVLKYIEEKGRGNAEWSVKQVLEQVVFALNTMDFPVEDRERIRKLVKVIKNADREVGKLLIEHELGGK
jgi:hypothetical protein